MFGAELIPAYCGILESLLAGSEAYDVLGFPMPPEYPECPKDCNERNSAALPAISAVVASGSFVKFFDRFEPQAHKAKHRSGYNHAEGQLPHWVVLDKSCRAHREGEECNRPGQQFPALLNGPPFRLADPALWLQVL